MPNHSNMARHARRGAKEVRHAARQVKSSANHQAGTVMRAVRRVGAEMNDAVRDGMDDLRESASDYVETGRARARALEESFEERVQERPIQAVLIAMGLGFLVGFFFTRR